MGCKANSPCPPGCCKGKESKDLNGQYKKDLDRNKTTLNSPGVEEKFEGLKK